jgi:hypothetical protein
MNTPFRLPTRRPFLRGEWQKQIRVGKLDIPDLKLIVPKRIPTDLVLPKPCQ